MDTGINVGSLLINVNNKKKIYREKVEKFTSKILEYNFFVRNEIEISNIINKNMTNTQKKGFFRFLTVERFNFMEIYNCNQKNPQFLNNFENFDDKKYVILEYKNIENDLDMDKLNYNSLIYFLLNNETIPLFLNITHFYEYFLKIFSFLSELNIRSLNFSSKNLLYSINDDCVYFKNFENCCKNDSLNENIKNINIFIKIIEKIDYFGNKHFDLFFIKMIIIKKDLFIILNNLEMIIDEYLNNLYYLSYFSENTKREIIIITKNYIKNMKIFQKNDETINKIVKDNRWKDYLSYYLTDSNCNSKSTIWEIFSINSFFLNISFCLLKFIEIEDKNSIIHKYIKFLVNNLNIQNSVDIIKNEKMYNSFMSSLEEDDIKYAASIKNICIENDEKYEIVYNYLLKNIEFF
jgi:hypothetical protein